MKMHSASRCFLVGQKRTDGGASETKHTKSARISSRFSPRLQSESEIVDFNDVHNKIPIRFVPMPLRSSLHFMFTLIVEHSCGRERDTSIWGSKTTIYDSLPRAL